MTKFFVYILLVATPLLTGCGGKNDNADNKIVVSIAPLKYIVEMITDGDYEVEVLVPEGASPETYSPTPKQMIAVEKAKYIFVTDLIDFERELVGKLPENIRNNNVINVSAGIELIYGEHHHDGHSGIDPHIWTSPKALRNIASTIYNTIIRDNPDSLKYTKAFGEFMAKLESAKERMVNEIEKSGKTLFVIYHPALSYYARNFGLEQISVEDDGKEPSAAHMEDIVRIAKDSGVKYILYQRQFPQTAVETIAKDCGAQPVEVNPLAENIIDELVRITGIITE